MEKSVYQAQLVEQNNGPQNSRVINELVTYLAENHAIEESIIKDNPEKYFRWFRFHNGEMVPFLLQEAHLKMRTDRNRDLVTSDQQKEIYNKKITVCGLSVGRAITKSFIRSGIGNEYDFYDADKISPTNLNRLDVGNNELGLNKIDSVVKEMSQIDPYIKFNVNYDGFQAKNSGQLTKDKKTDLVCDEMDDIKSKVLLAMSAREYGIDYELVTDLGHKSVIDVSQFSKGEDRLYGGNITDKEAQLILDSDLSEKDEQRFIVKILGKWLLLSEVDLVLSIVQKKERNLNGIPQLYSTVNGGASRAVEVTRALLLGEINSRSFREVFKPAKHSSLNSRSQKLKKSKEAMIALLSSSR